MTSHIREQIDLLHALRLPDRYEPLFETVGQDVVQILLPPADEIRRELQRVVDDVRAGGQGTLVPLAGESGAGKTTLASSAAQWQPTAFTPTVDFSGKIAFEELKAAVDHAKAGLPANERRIIPINIDHRESAPPSREELSTLKRFLRTSPCGVQNVIFWPETDQETARSIGEQYKQIAGAQPVSFIQVGGPSREAWRDIAIDTLRLSNSMANLEDIGVDPRSYEPEQFPSLGEFLRRIKIDFNLRLEELRSSLAKAVVLVIVFVSESNDPGTLLSVTNSSRYGRLDAHGLVSSTPESALGRWWSLRKGLLIRTIVQLNAHALFLPPAATMSALRNCGPNPDEFMDKLGLPRVGPGRAARDLARTDVAKVLGGIPLLRYEGRGNPAHDATAAFQLLAERGFNLGRDKSLNGIMAEAWREYFARNGIEVEEVKHEKGLDFCALIPDNSIVHSDTVVCIEYTWRKGDFLSSGNRSTVAQYILEKLRDYVRAMGWSAD
jgi:hypothetical protein